MEQPRRDLSRGLRRMGLPSGDRGMVTAEFAVALPALLLLLSFSLGAVNTAMDKLRCVDAARDAALSAARGGESAKSDAPAGAIITVVTTGDLVRATASVRSSPLGPHLPGLTVSGSAIAAKEPDGLEGSDGY